MAVTDPDEVQKQVQGNILRGYGNQYRCVRHWVLRVTDAPKARAVLGGMVNGDRSTPEVTSGEQAPAKAGMRWCLNLGITYHGLESLGVPAATLGTFPPEFVEGMVARASRLGDYGRSAPRQWIGEFRDPDQVDLIVSIHGRGFADIDPISNQVVRAAGGDGLELVSFRPLDGEMLQGAAGDARVEHFGYRDGISQPRFEGIHEPGNYAEHQQFTPLGAVLLGHRTPVAHVRWRVPDPPELGLNGSFNAFRVLRQDVGAFEEFLAATEARLGYPAELVAAKMCGRWRNGAPLSLAPNEADAERAVAAAKSLNDLNDFDYLDLDADGDRCPVGSHIRRTNPRRAHIVQRAAGRTRPIVRRGIPYGKPFDRANPDTVERGLLGSFICANLAAQFESIQHDWLNLGLQDPRITGTNDPLVGVNDTGTSHFDWTDEHGEAVVVRGIPRFVQTRGGAYCFLPSVPALKWIASAGWNAR